MKKSEIKLFFESIPKVISHDHQSVFYGKDDYSFISPIDNIKRLNNYPKYNLIPNVLFAKIIRIPSFFISSAFFSCAGWLSLSNNEPIRGISRFFSIDSSGHIHFIYSQLPILSWGTALGVFIALIYNITLYQKAVRYFIRTYKQNYASYLFRTLNAVARDPNRQTAAFVYSRNYSLSVIFLYVENDDVVPVIINVGTLSCENEHQKVYQEYKPLQSGDSYKLALTNEFGKKYDLVKISRDDINITISDDNTVFNVRKEGNSLICDNLKTI